VLRPEVDPSRVDQLRFGPRRDAERGALDEDYRAGLFAEPYTATYYRGFVDSAGLPGVSFAGAVAAEARPRSPARRRAAIGLLSTAGVFGLACAVTAGLAYQAKRDFDATTFQRPASEASRRFDGFGWAAGVSGALSLVLGITGAVLMRP